MQISILQTKQFLNSFFTLKEQRVSTKLLLSLIIVAYIFGVGVRLVWAFQNHGVEAFKFNNEFIINSPDGFYFAEGARDILAGGHELNDNSPVDRAISILTAILYKIIPFISFETLIFYMPAFIAPLIVVPMILIGKELKNVLFGFYASIIALFSFGFYARTFVGYYDDESGEFSSDVSEYCDEAYSPMQLVMEDFHIKMIDPSEIESLRKHSGNHLLNLFNLNEDELKIFEKSVES